MAAFDATACGSTSCSSIVNLPAPGRAGERSVAQGTLFVAGGDSVTAYAPDNP